jgi:hypothetical protein
MESMHDEVKRLLEQYEKQNESLTVDAAIAAAKNKAQYPELHRYIWEAAESDLAQEARRARMYKLMIAVKITHTGGGSTTRLFVHVKGSEGYRAVSHVAKDVDLVAIKLRQLLEDIGRCRARLDGFKSFIPKDLADRLEYLFAESEQFMRDSIDKRGGSGAAAPPVEAA